MSAADVVLRVDGLTRRYGDLLAVDHLSLEVHRGEILGFLGPNGAGKSTCLKMISGLLRPDEGRVEILGQELRPGQASTLRLLGVAPQEIVIWETLTCRTIFELLTVGVVPFFVLMFFSDCFFPLPKIRLFDLASHPFYLTDFLPTALTVRAVDRILNAGASLGDVSYELTVMAALTAVYFVIGGALFMWRHMRG